MLLKIKLTKHKRNSAITPRLKETYVEKRLSNTIESAGIVLTDKLGGWHSMQKESLNEVSTGSGQDQLKTFDQQSGSEDVQEDLKVVLSI